MELVMPPHRVKVVISAAEEPRKSSEVARLVALLRGEGLTGSTVKELLKPESAAKLRRILTDRAFPEREERDPGPVQPEESKVLVFKKKEAIKP
jgi:hypothetical protein